MPSSRYILGRIGSVVFDSAVRYFERKSEEEADRRGAQLGHMIMRLDRKHREQTIGNLHLAFPELSEAERMALARRTYEHFGRLAADFLRSRLRTNEQVIASTTVEGAHYVEEARDLGRGVIGLTAHFGNWERYARFGTAMGWGITVVARDADDEGFQKKLLEFRNTTGIEVLSRGNAARSILGALKKQRLVGILPDQNSEECFVPFFGHPCGTTLGPAVIHKRSGAPMVPTYCVRTGIGQYHAIIKPPIEVPSGEPEDIAAEMNRVLESVIREYPDQYLWLHDRWRSAKRRGLLSVPQSVQ